MIRIEEGFFHLQTKDNSYIFCQNKWGKLNHLYYGKRLDDSLDSLRMRPVLGLGSSVLYDKEDVTSSLDTFLSEFSEPQVGDYKILGLDIWVGNQQATDFKVVGYELDCVLDMSCPRGHGYDEVLKIELKDSLTGIGVNLYYVIFEAVNVISRYTEVFNHSSEPCRILKCSVSVDMMNSNFKIMNFNGGWARETNVQVNPLGVGRTEICSTTISSSNRSNPGFLLADGYALENYGDVYGFNLIYSGSHSSVIERTSHEQVRIVSGINPEQFEWVCQSGERFSSPSLVMTYGQGYNGVSHNFHDFVNKHIVPVEWAFKDRPIVYNHWESTFFDYHEKRLLRLARQAKDLGCELFVLDDGWFTERNDDTRGLSNYSVDKKKFRRGLTHFFDEIRAMGMKCGIWVEPEMISVESELYRQHPEYALGGKRPLRFGRNQLVLDLTNAEVRDYIVKNLTKLIDDLGIDYIKWDMNRHISDIGENQKEFAHRYILGLYEVLERIFTGRNVLLETCSSGGNRFDLGMLSFGAQVWSSDDTDPIERLRIQTGLSYLYPLSTISAHVAGGVSQQTLRSSPLSTRFNVASFGVLGYELDLELLTPVEKREIRGQTAWYKEFRKVFQYGQFYRFDKIKDNMVYWQVSYEDISIVGVFQTLAQASPSADKLKVIGLDPMKQYRLTTKSQRVMIDRFKELIKHVSPIHLNPEGVIMNVVNKQVTLKDGVLVVTGIGHLFENGIWLNSQYLSTGYHPDLRLWGDFGSSLYIVREIGD